MPHQEKLEPRILKDYVKLLGGFSLLLMIVTLGEAIWASLRYGANAQGIESISHRDLSQRWTIVLLWIPLTMQVLILMFLTGRVWKHKSSQTMRHYFKFYFVRTFISSFTYVSLWLAYTFVMTSADAPIVHSLRSAALIFILLLMCFVIQATYLITRHSLRSGRRLFRENDLAKEYDCVCKNLGSVATTSHAIPVRSELHTIHEWLLKDTDYKVHRVAYKGTMADLDLPDLVDALNRLVRNRRFYDHRFPSVDGDDVPPSLFEANNREFIEFHLINPCKTNPDKGHAESSKPRKDLWEKLLGGDGKSDRQMGQRDGIAMFPFYTMVFFFSVFLCIAYLFGFAFAFEDRLVQLSTSKPSLGLIMVDDLLEDVGQYSVPTAPPAPITYKLSDRQKFFYFKPGGAGITTAIAPNESDARLKHIARINERSLSSLVEQIKSALPKGNVRVLLVGRADEKSVDRITYASNYDIAKARINSVRYLLQEKLIASHTPRTNLALIDWIESPFSSDITLVPKRKQEREESKMSQVLDNDTASEEVANDKVPKELISKLDEDVNLKYGDKAWCGEFRDFLGRLREQARRNAVTLNEMRQIHDDITRWAVLKDSTEQAKAENLGDDIDAELYQIEDPPGRRRAVEVYLYNSQSTSPAPSNTSNPVPHAKRMTLMDYLYFAMYTITTTGYGDIKPITPYSKFLCTVANMTEFFFIVVFFNTLLSLKRRKRKLV